MSLHIIATIARYEMRTLLRSWFFRIFAVMAVVGLAIFNLALNVVSSGSPWIYRALPASIPYANLIILNLGQAIVAVFLASEFLKQDKKNDTSEVIYTRSMSNGQYLLGKTLGILYVFLVLNIIILLIGIGFSFMNHVSLQHILYYFAYPLLISLPTLVFILGLSFFAMIVIRNQAVTFIIILGYIALTIFYLNKKLFHIFDYIAYQVPMMYSSISGFGDFSEIILHRCIYFFLGVGLIYLTIWRLPRLPQSSRHYLSLITGLFFILLAGFFTQHYLNMKFHASAFKEQAVSLNNQYAFHPRIAIARCDLDVKHGKHLLHVTANLAIWNPDVKAADTLVFSLNPGLKLNSVTINHKLARFDRNIHIIRVFPDIPLPPGDSAILTMQYAGSIDENICFLDQDLQRNPENFKIEVFTLRKRYAFLQRDYVCLTAESIWYPVSGAGYATVRPMYCEPDFVRYSMQVTTDTSLIAISQGKVANPSKGRFHFRPEYPLTQLSLVIGKYMVRSIRVDSVEFKLYTIKDHDYFASELRNVGDTLGNIIHTIKQEYEVKTGLSYPFERFMLVEVPAHYAVDKHIYSYTSDAVQPEMIFYPEKGILSDASDFRYLKHRLEKDSKNTNENLLPEEIEARLLRQFLHNNYLAGRDQFNNFDRLTDGATFSAFPQYFSFVTKLNAPDWPVLNIAFDAYVRERNSDKLNILQWYDDLSKNEKINLELGRASLRELLTMGITPATDENDPVVLNDIVLAKGNQLFNVLKARLRENALDSLVTGLISEYPHGLIPFQRMNEAFSKRFEMDLEKEIETWYDQKVLPGFIIRHLTSYKIKEDEATRFQIRFIVTNPEKTDGIITLHVELNDPNRTSDNSWTDNFNIDFSRTINVPANSSREVGYVFNSEPARISIVTHVSRNLPSNLIFTLPGFNETRDVHGLDGIFDVAVQSVTGDKNEIVVDNEDPGFKLVQSGNEAYLKTLVNRSHKKAYNYTRLSSWSPPRVWNQVLRSEFYGNYVHSAYYTRSGIGERTVFWKAHLPEKSTYDVYFFLNKPNMVWRQGNKSPDYNFLVYHDGGIDKVNRSSEDAEPGWVLLGTYSISSDTGRIELSNKSIGDMVFADAVKWVLSK